MARHQCGPGLEAHMRLYNDGFVDETEHQQFMEGVRLAESVLRDYDLLYNEVGETKNGAEDITITIPVEEE
jgi:hypothetical protein